MPYLPPPIFPPSFDFIDDDAKTIALHLMETFNYNTLQALPNPPFIKTYRTYNDAAVPVVDMPCLLCYRAGETLVTPNGYTSSTDFVNEKLTYFREFFAIFGKFKF